MVGQADGYIAILDYGVGNLRSVEKALEKLGRKVLVTASVPDVRGAAGIILPGVGAFGPAMARLRQAGLVAVLQEALADGKPMLGICLGMQLLFCQSVEGGRNAGLAFIPGRVVPLEGRVKVPHMGWNRVFPRPGHPLFTGVEPGTYFYFVHSYHGLPGRPETVAATTMYGGREIAAAIQQGSACGVQFHPEKSGGAGLQVLANFGRLVDGGGRQEGDAGGLSGHPGH